MMEERSLKCSYSNNLALTNSEGSAASMSRIDVGVSRDVDDEVSLSALETKIRTRYVAGGSCPCLLGK